VAVGLSSVGLAAWWGIRALPRRPLTVVGLVLIAWWVFVVIAGPLLSAADPLAQQSARLQEPSAAHPFGTDNLGRDVLSRVLYGARLSLPYAMLLVGLSCTIGTALGGLAGYYGGVIDEAIMRLVDVVFAFPKIILAMAVAAALGPGIFSAVFALLVVSWPTYARVVRALILTMKHADFVVAARLLGASSGRALLVEILPNVAGAAIVLAMLEMGTAVLLLAGLSFLGLGARPPAPEWGAMVSDGAQVFNQWWVGTFPGLAISTAVLGFNFLGDALRDRLDPRMVQVLRRPEA
jgi:ABC-type dipeptide/oligopeptide/nickel transport system permease subunit